MSATIAQLKYLFGAGSSIMQSHNLVLNLTLRGFERIVKFGYMFFYTHLKFLKISLWYVQLFKNFGLAICLACSLLTDMSHSKSKNYQTHWPKTLICAVKQIAKLWLAVTHLRRITYLHLHCKCIIIQQLLTGGPLQIVDFSSSSNNQYHSWRLWKSFLPKYISCKIYYAFIHS